MEWEAVYNDGTSLSQFNEDGSENKYTDIKRGQLSRFIIYHGAVPLLIVHLDGNKQLIYRRRVAMHLLGSKAGSSDVVILAGWQENRRGVNVQCLCFVFEDGHVEVLDRFYEDVGLFSHVKFEPEEKVGGQQR